VRPLKQGVPREAVRAVPDGKPDLLPAELADVHGFADYNTPTRRPTD
jgi:hypothetical protein